MWQLNDAARLPPFQGRVDREAIGAGSDEIRRVKTDPTRLASLRIGWSENRFALFGPMRDARHPPLKREGGLTISA